MISKLPPNLVLIRQMTPTLGISSSLLLSISLHDRRLTVALEPLDSRFIRLGHAHSDYDMIAATGECLFVANSI